MEAVDVRFSVIVPTIGRASLERTLASIRAQRIQEGDQVLVVSDGPASDWTRRLWEDSGLPGQLHELADGPHYDWAGTPRNRALEWVTGTHVLYIDDDDCYVPGAFETIRGVIHDHPSALLLFRCRFLDGTTIWQHPFLVRGLIATSNLCFPADVHPGAFGLFYEGDYQFIRQTIEGNTDRPVIWVPEVIVTFRHDHQPAALGDTINCLWVGSALSVLERLSIASYLRNGHGVTLWAYDDLGGVPAGTEVVDAREILARDAVFQYRLEWFERPNYSAFSDCFRFKLLLERGGWWSDLDVICLRPYDDLAGPWVIPSEVDQGRRKPTSCVLRAPSGNEAMAWAWEQCQGIMGRPSGGLVGPPIVEGMVERFRLADGVHPPEAFCPISFDRWRRFLEADDAGQCSLQHETARSYACHLWHELWLQGGADKRATWPAASQIEKWKRHYLSYLGPRP